jgi:hypothetical protein
VVSSSLVPITTGDLAVVIDAPRVGAAGAWKINGYKLIVDLGKTVLAGSVLNDADNFPLIIDGGGDGSRAIRIKDGCELAVLEQKSFLNKCLAVDICADDLPFIVDSAYVGRESSGKINGGDNTRAEHETVLIAVLIKECAHKHSGVIDSCRHA